MRELQLQEQQARGLRLLGLQIRGPQPGVLPRRVLPLLRSLVPGSAVNLVLADSGREKSD